MTHSTRQPALPTASGQPATDPLTPPGFPGRVPTGVCMVVAPPLLALLCMLGTGIYHFRGHDFLAAMATHATRTEVFLNLVPMGVFALMLAVLGLAAMAARRSPRLAALGGIAALLGLCGPIFFIAIEFAGYQLSSSDRLADGAYMYDQANMVPRISLNVSGPAIILGFIALAVAAHGAGLFGKPQAICFALTALLPVGFIAAVLPVSAVGFAACAVALVPLGRSLLRRTPGDG
ncbi:hypothetical protein [Flexivirga oryzae]|uniref:DUF4386 family protein n=1 Tax=Flexivirga oryzae TaxID=1794944 RepID=A0A839N6F5_9MICO|nr:hypothetical protein [Flexivirga oryzae]MBB2890785.1 hypothetical protein [Flexivirga oryzae]